MHDPSPLQTRPGTNGCINTQPLVATEIFCICFSCRLACYNGHYKTPCHMALHSHSYEAIPPWNMATLHITHSLPANEPPKGEGVCRGIGYTAHEMCTMWLSSAVGSQSQAPLSLLCLDTDSE